MHKDNKKHYNQTLLAFFLHHFLKKISFSTKYHAKTIDRCILNDNSSKTHKHNPMHLIYIEKDTTNNNSKNKCRVFKVKIIYKISHIPNRFAKKSKFQDARAQKKNEKKCL